MEDIQVYFEQDKVPNKSGYTTIELPVLCALIMSGLKEHDELGLIMKTSNVYITGSKIDFRECNNYTDGMTVLISKFIDKKILSYNEINILRRGESLYEPLNIKISLTKKIEPLKEFVDIITKNADILIKCPVVNDFARVNLTMSDDGSLITGLIPLKDVIVVSTY